MPFSIRAAEQADAEAVARVHVAGWRWGYRGLLPEETLAGVDERERGERLRGVMADEEAGVSVYLAQADDGEVVGFVSCGPARDADAAGPSGPAWDADSAGPFDPARSTGEVYALYIAEHVAGAGVGPALLRSAVDDLTGRGFAQATLWVLDSNARARRFYEREGWAADGATKTDELRGATLSEVRYRREL